MRNIALMAAGVVTLAASLQAQQTCANYSVVVNSPEDKLMLAVNGADNPQEQVAALEKFSQEHADSKFVPCVDQYLTKAYVKLQQYDKAIDAGEKAVAANYLDVPFLESLLQAFTASGKADSQAFDILFKAAPAIQADSNPSRPAKATDAEWQQLQKQAEQGAEDERTYMSYAFFQILQRVSDPAQRIAALDKFAQAYPEAAQKQAALLNYQYAVAYTMSNQADKADEYAKKTITTDPSNVEALNLLAFDYAIRRRTNLDQAVAYAEKVIALVPAMKKPNGASDDQFKAEQNNQLGMAHLSLGYILLVRASSGRRFATHAQMSSAINELKTASNLLRNNPRLQGGALYYLGTAYEGEYPAQHREAISALTKAIELQTPWQSPARELLVKVKRAAH